MSVQRPVLYTGHTQGIKHTGRYLGHIHVLWAPVVRTLLCLVVVEPGEVKVEGMNVEAKGMERITSSSQWCILAQVEWADKMRDMERSISAFQWSNPADTLLVDGNSEIHFSKLTQDSCEADVCKWVGSPNLKSQEMFKNGELYKFP